MKPAMKKAMKKAMKVIKKVMKKSKTGDDRNRVYSSAYHAVYRGGQGNKVLAGLARMCTF